MEARARAKHIRVSPRKVRQVLGLIKGKPVEEAVDTLRLTNRPVAHRVQKLLQSAIANAVDRSEDEIDIDQLRVKNAVADPGPTMKRWLPRARGRATRLLKRSSHITIVVSDE